MRTRKSQNTIERYGVTLAPSVAVEAHIIATTLAEPRGRRQQWLRHLLLLGAKNQHLSTLIDQSQVISAHAGVTNKLMSICLNRHAADDGFILGQIEAIPLVRRSQTLRTWLSIGTKLESQSTVIEPDFSHNPTAFQTIPKQILADTTTEMPRPPVRSKSIKDAITLKTVVSKVKTGSFSAFEGEKIVDNSFKAIVSASNPRVDRLKEPSNKRLVEVDWEIGGDDAEKIPATETVVSVTDLPKQPIALDFDLGLDFDLETGEMKTTQPESASNGKNPKLAAMRGLFI